MVTPGLWEAMEEAESDSGYPQELTYELLESMRRIDPGLNSFITVNGAAVEQARRRSGKGPLRGLPIAIKDSITTDGIETTCGSRILEGYVPPYNSTAVERLIAAGGVVLGKTNMDEFSMGSTGENSYFGPTRNPWDLERVPGGSSSGSAAAVSAGLAPAALGADTGGSVRAPACFTATFGLKPTYGRVSRYGLIAYANSMEQIGPITRDTRDAALLMSIIAGWDPKDPTSSKEPIPDYLGALDVDVKGWKIAIVKEMVDGGVDGDILRSFWRAVDEASSLGIDIEMTSVKYLGHALAAYYIIACSEASSNLARYDGLRYGMTGEYVGNWRKVFAKIRGEGFGREVKVRIMLGTYMLSAGYYEEFYLKALKVRRLVAESFYRLFKKYRLLLSPTMPILPPRLGEKLMDPLAMYMMDVETVPASLAGIPSASLPAGFSKGLPIGLQIMGPPFGEPEIFAFSARLEEKLGLNPRPPISL